MKWFIYAALQMVCMVICYLTNWLVVIFANEEGELPGFLRLWQTWDDTLDNKTDVGRMPSFLQYDWDSHYAQSKVTEKGQTRYVEQLVEPFGLADRIRRYFCRCHWLYRNCAYGFAFYLFGRDVTPPVQQKTGKDWYFCHQGSTWAFKCESEIKNGWKWKIYLGWKIQRSLDNEHRAMIANRLWFSKP